MYTEFSFRSNIISATPDLCLEDLTIEQTSWYGWENLYSSFKNDALFGYLTYLCFLLLRQKSSLSNVGGCREVQVCSLSSVRSHLRDSISPSVKWGQLLSRCWTSRKGGRSAVSESWFWKWIWALLWCGKARWCLKSHFCQRLWENPFVWNICKILPLWVRLHPRLVCGVGVEYLQTPNHLSARTDPFLLFLLIRSPKPFLTLADPVSPVQDIIYFPWSLLLRPLSQLTLTLNAADIYNFPFEGRFP